MAVNNVIGATLSIAVATPGTADESGYEALSYTEIENVVSIGAFGDTSEDISFNLLKEGRTSHVSGVKDLGEIPVSVAYDAASSTGIDLVDTYKDTNTVLTWKLEYNDGRTVYWQGRSANFQETELTASSYEGRTFVIRGTSAVLRVAAP